MKYVLKNTQYRGDTETVEEMYMNGDDWSVYFHTHKLSRAKIWDTFDEAWDFLSEETMEDHKIVEIDEKALFEARLNGK